MKLDLPILVLLLGCSATVACGLSGDGAKGSGGAGESGGPTSSTQGSAASTASTSSGGPGTSGSGGSAGRSTSGSGGSDPDGGASSTSTVATGGAAGQGAGGAGAGGGGGSSGAGGSNPRDAGAVTSKDAASTTPPGGYGAGPIVECPPPSLDRIQQWTAHANTTPGSGNLLVKDGDRYVAKVTFPGGNWSEVVVPVNNNETIPGDLSKSAGFTMTYSATADFWGQLRGTVQAHGGDQNVVKLPSTGGNMSTLSFRFVQDDWTFVPGLGRPTVTLASVLPSAVFFNFVGNTANTIAFYDLRFDNYLPTCR